MQLQTARALLRHFVQFSLMVIDTDIDLISRAKQEKKSSTAKNSCDLTHEGWRGPTALSVVYLSTMLASAAHQHNCSCSGYQFRLLCTLQHSLLQCTARCAAEHRETVRSDKFTECVDCDRLRGWCTTGKKAFKILFCSFLRARQEYSKLNEHSA